MEKSWILGVSTVVLVSGFLFGVAVQGYAEPKAQGGS